LRSHHRNIFAGIAPRWRERWRFLILLLAALAPGKVSGQTVDWVRRIGTLGLDEALGVAVDSAGVYVAGYADGELPDLDKIGGQDAYLRKFDLSGNVVWTRQFGSIFEDQARGVAVDATGVYVVGTVGASLADRTDLNRYDAFARKYDAGGNLLWTRVIASIGTLQNDYATAVAVDANGLYVAGYTAGTLAGQSRFERDGAVDAPVRRQGEGFRGRRCHQFVGRLCPRGDGSCLPRPELRGGRLRRLRSEIRFERQRHLDAPVRHF
jgi:hypothetical protein